jgi:hypothetical protein
MIEPLIRWLNASQKGYDITSCGLRLASKWYADDGTLITNTVDDMITLLDIVEQFSDWSGIRLNVGKCKITAYIQGLQSIRKKKDRDDALKARLAHVTIGDQRIRALSQDELLPGGYLGTPLQPRCARTPTSNGQNNRSSSSAKRSHGPLCHLTSNNASSSMERTLK